ncbi:glycosyltransferase [Ferruginibacter paludis]|uniref:glycosyltransferase n=1 Tax=Ferruginibacter paludis TaxID=1310417 RepID=UPI0025B5B62A|nr:glycosyltransferase [Ferruginibacter paludis]MDN3656769.1 glycosyltransferase [Ferruginibacter paludis]
MMSIIICSVNSKLLGQLRQNIAETIGIEYEIIAIDNSSKKEGICSVYNKGGATARYPILCFMHEDILFETSNWGLLIVQHFRQPKTGLLGIAGGDSKGLVPSSWSSSFKSNEINIIQHTEKKREARHIVETYNNLPGTKKKAVTLDGVLLCTRKEIFAQLKFDEVNLKGFHGYDIDYSLQVFCYFEVAVMFDVVVHHFSEGKPDNKWVESAVVISRKWKKQLPVSVYPLTPAEFNFYHWKSLQVFLERLFQLNYSYPKIILYYLRFSCCRYFTIRRFLSMGKYVFVIMWHGRYKNKQAVTGCINEKIIHQQTPVF